MNWGFKPWAFPRKRNWDAANPTSRLSVRARGHPITQFPLDPVDSSGWQFLQKLLQGFGELCRSLEVENVSAAQRTQLRIGPS